MTECCYLEWRGCSLCQRTSHSSPWLWRMWWHWSRCCRLDSPQSGDQDSETWVLTMILVTDLIKMVIRPRKQCWVSLCCHYYVVREGIVEIGLLTEKYLEDGTKNRTHNCHSAHAQWNILGVLSANDTSVNYKSFVYIQIGTEDRGRDPLSTICCC